MRRFFGSRIATAGVVLIAAGLILGRIDSRSQGSPHLSDGRLVTSGGWSNTAYDVAAVVAWLLILVGLIWVVLGLIRYWTAQRRATRAPRPS